MKQVLETYLDHYTIELLAPQDEGAMTNLIRRNLDSFEEAGSVLAATFRRLENLYDFYSQEGSAFFVVRDRRSDSLIGGTGLGPLAGLPVSEGMGEIRELVIENQYRGQGLGARLLSCCLTEARRLGYKRLYLETTPQMEQAQQLFRRFGFRPVTQKKAAGKKADECGALPCYYMLESLDEPGTPQTP